MTGRSSLGTVWRMQRLAPRLAMILVATSFVLLGTATPSWAHSERSGAFSREAPAWHADLAITYDGLDRLALSADPGTPLLPWPVLVGALLAVALCRERPRRAIALAVVLLLAVLCFEDGLHSVHHLTGQGKLARCSVSTATAHLRAITVDSVANTDIVLPVIAVAIESRQTDPVARFLSPDQGRAPPSPIA